MDGIQYDLLLETLRVLLLICVPIVVVLGVAGAISGALQGATSIHDPAVGYGVKVLALVALLYFLLPAFWQNILVLLQSALGRD